MTDGIRRSTSRITGFDLARFLALAGMMATHLWSVDGTDFSTPALSAALSGKAAALFAVLAGVGIALTSRHRREGGTNASIRWAVAGRGLVLVVLGMTLGLVPGGVVVILVYYGVLFWVMIPLLTLSTRTLAVLAVVWAAVWPVTSWWLRRTLDAREFELGSANWGDLADPLSFVRGLLVTGTYPVLTWAVYALIGMVIGRLALAAREIGRERTLSVRLLLGGAVVAVVSFSVGAVALGPLGGRKALALAEGVTPPTLDSYLSESRHGTVPTTSLWWLATPAPHSGTPVDLGVTAGIAAAVIGLCLLLGTVLGPLARRVLSPVTAAGGAPLTIYTLHVLAIALVLTMPMDFLAGPPWTMSSLHLWLLHVAGALVVGGILAVLGRRGPLEAATTWVSGRMARWGRLR